MSLFAMAAYRASRHEASGYSPNFLAVDIVYGSVDEDCDESYDRFVENVRERMTAAFAEIRETLRRSTERNKKYYDISVKPNKFKVGQWSYTFIRESVEESR